MKNKEQISHCIDNICQQGCDVVRNTIAAIENGEIPEQVSLLGSKEKQHVLTELKDIMAVYDTGDF